MISLDEFVAAHLGQYLDFDGVYGAQCVDLVLFYLRDVWGLPPLPGNAIDEFGENPERITWTRNNPADASQIPAKGSIAIWGPDYRVGTGVLGHTAVVLNAGPAGFQSFDQNWPLNAPCRIVAHIYSGVIGWGMPQGGDVMTPAQESKLDQVLASVNMVNNALILGPDGKAEFQPAGPADYAKLFEDKIARIVEAKLKAAGGAAGGGGFSDSDRALLTKLQGLLPGV